MDSSVRRVCVLVIAIALAVSIFALTLPWFSSARGVNGPTIADTARPIMAALVAFLAFSATTVIAVLVGRMVNAVVALFVLGTGVGLLAMRSGSALDFAFGHSSVLAGAIEVFCWALLVAAASWAIFRFGGALPDVPLTHDDDIDSPIGSAARKSWFAAIAAVVVAWGVVITMNKGQAIGATVAAGFVAGAIGRMLAPRTPPIYLAAVTIAAFAAVFAFYGFTLRGDLAVGIVDGSLPRLLRLMPVDIAAGVLAGVSLGFGFARGFVATREA